MSRGQAKFIYTKYNVPTADSRKATVVIAAGGFSNFRNIEGYCANVKHYHHLFLSDGKMHTVYCLTMFACGDIAVSTASYCQRGLLLQLIFGKQVKLCICRYNTFLLSGTLPPVTIIIIRRTTNSITVNIRTIPDGVDRVIIGYHRLDLGQPVVGQYVNNQKRSSITFPSLVPGAQYRITAWGLGGGSDKRRSYSPAVVEVATKQQSEFK